jgi:membrane fusion protein (multidrug efflux system)
VFRVVEGKAVRAAVKTGQRRDSKVEILSGVDKGDTVVIAGQIRLRDGVSVRVAGADTKANAAKAAPEQPAPSKPKS